MNAQRGFGLLGYFAVVLVIGAVTTGAWAFFKHYQHLVEERAQARQQLADALEANDEQASINKVLRADIKKRDELLARRERARQAAERARKELDAELQALRGRPEVAAWMDARVPDAVLERLRAEPGDPGGGAPGGAPVPTDKPAAHEPGTEPEGKP